jgi:hypothetical protein
VSLPPPPASPSGDASYPLQMSNPVLTSISPGGDLFASLNYGMYDTADLFEKDTCIHARKLIEVTYTKQNSSSK